MTVEVETHVSLLQGDLRAVEAELEVTRARITESPDPHEQTRLLKAERALQDRLSALTRATQAAEAEAAAKEKADAESRVLDWKERLYPQARAELGAAESETLSALTKTREAFDRWGALYTAWEAQHRVCGGCEPRLKRFPKSFSDWLSPNPLDPSTREVRLLLR